MTTPEPEPVEQESDAALPFASTAEMCVVIDGASTSRRARPPRYSCEWKSRSRTAFCPRIVSIKSAVSKEPPRSSSCKPYAISTPPDDGGGFDAKSCERNVVVTGLRVMTR